ncbi:hypothetical protein [Salmonella phage SP1]|uniref:Uncharacterized protein n=1 Tax=Salmonella phage SP1 TaxID=2025818 RepID=A0A249Y0H7_9CAUD|nr:hypothetical protein HYP23_gp203 [Salmonella phage SP1]ASZ77717.1 hypothetical protein [Salmonella phage SP1]
MVGKASQALWVQLPLTQPQMEWVHHRKSNYECDFLKMKKVCMPTS